MASTTVKNEIRHYDTIVLGAGISGLACASKLYSHPHYKQKGKLLVLEARDRIGGRINAVRLNGCRLDTGANWIHGVGTKDEPNPLMTILPGKRSRSLAGTVFFKAESEQEKGEDADQDGWVEVGTSQSLIHGNDRVIPVDIAGTIMSSLWAMIESLHDLAEKATEQEAKNTTMLHAIRQSKALREAYLKIPPAYHSSLGAMPQFMETMEAAPLAAQSSEHRKDQAGMSLLEFGLEDFDGEQVFLQDGYIEIVEEVAKHLVKDELIELETEVKAIDWNSGNLVKIETEKGNFAARQVICTLPLGVLQHHVKEGSGRPIFRPELPEEKRTAINSLGFGTLDKIMLIYDSPWWTEEPYLSIFAKGLVKRPWNSEDSGGRHNDTPSSPDSMMGVTTSLPGLSITAQGTSSSNTTTGPRSLSIVNLQSLTGQPVLSSFVSCANALAIENMTDAKASSIVHNAMTDWFGIEPPHPAAVHVTRWAKDEFSKGSYSHMITGLSETKHRVEFQKKVIGEEGAVLRFAGEHTSRNHFATAHGALLSGWREADDIIASLGGR